MKRTLIAVLIAIGIAGIAQPVQASLFGGLFGAGSGTIGSTEHWVSTTTPSASMTQKIWGKAIQITGLSDGCLYLLSGILSSNAANATCTGGGGSGGGTWSTTTSQVSGQEVNYSNNTDDIVAIGANSTTTAEVWFDPNTARYIFVGTTPRLGIGTTSPSTSLQVAGAMTQLPSTNLYGQLDISDTTNPRLRMSLGVLTTAVGGGSAGTGVIQSLTNATGFNPTVINPSGGNVGVGTSSPASIFNIRGALPGFTITDTTNSSTAELSTAGSIPFVSEDTSGSLNGRTRAAINFITDNTFHSAFGIAFQTLSGGVLENRMVIDSLGNIGVGSSSPYSRFSIYGQNNETSAPLVDVFKLASLASTSVFRIDANGKIQDGNGKTVSNGANVLVATTTYAGDTTSISTAISMLPSGGGSIELACGIYTITSPIYIDKSNITIRGQGPCTNIRFNAATVPVAITSSDYSAQRSYITLEGMLVQQTGTAGTGTGIDFSNWALSRFVDVDVSNTNIGYTASTSGSYYNTIDSPTIGISGTGSVGIIVDNVANMNTIINPRIIPTADSIGIYINAHSTNCISCEVETGALIGIDIGSSGHNTTLQNTYLEANQTNLRLASGVEGVRVTGYIADATTANITDNGAIGFSKDIWLDFNPQRQFLGLTTLDYASTTVISNSGNSYFSQSTGSLFVGTTTYISSSEKVVVQTTGDTGLKIASDGTAHASGIVFGQKGASNTVTPWLVGTLSDGTNNEKRLFFSGGNNISMTNANMKNFADVVFNATGEVGIGTSSPYQRLSVAGGNIHVGGVVISTSTTASNIFPYASTTATSAGTFCLTGDSCITSWPSAGGGAFPFTTTSNFGQTANSTTTQVWFRGSPVSLSASSTAYFEDVVINGTATINNLIMPPIVFDTDAGAVNAMDIPQAAAAAGTRQVLHFNIDGTPIWSVAGIADGAGNIGTTSASIGTTTPWGKLSVDSVGIPKGQAAFAVGSSTYPILMAGFGANTNVGIGTSSPYAKLSVVGDVVASHFTATTSTASTFPYASTTGLSVGGRTIAPTYDKSITWASSTPDSNFVSYNTATSSRVIWLPTIPVGLASFGCKVTKGSGTVHVNFATGLATTTLPCTTTYASVASSLTWTAGASVYVSASSTAPSGVDDLVITGAFYNQ